MNILRLRRGGSGRLLSSCASRQLTLKQLQTSLDVDVARIKVCGASVCIQGIGDLVVARLVQSAQVIPNFRNVRVQANCTRVGIQSIAVLVDLVVKNTNRAPEGRVAAIAIDRLLVSFVRLGVFRHGHVATTEKIPTLSVIVIW
jgi:hypothetical protein